MAQSYADWVHGALSQRHGTGDYMWDLAAQRYPKIIVSKSEQPKTTNTHTQNEGGLFSAKGAGGLFAFLG